MDTSKIKYVVFDVFGTVVDWHTSIVNEGEKLAKEYNIEGVDWHAFANQWRDAGYIKTVFETAKGLREYVSVDEVFYSYLVGTLCKDFNLSIINEEGLKNFSRVWHNLMPCDDVLEGINRLKTNYAIGPFTNGDFDLMIDMKKNADIPLDFITTADIFNRYKPDPQIYIDELKLLRSKPEEIVMVAAHPFDMDNAKVAGYTTIFVPRPMEYGENSEHIEPEGKMPVDYICKNFIELAKLLEV